jgi:hydroxyacylglutathione hydrolase
MSALEIHRLPAFTDNYVWLFRYDDDGAAAVVDPAEAGVVFDALGDLGWRLSHILNTHHHPDHVGGNTALKEATGCTVVGAANDADRIPGIDVRVAEGDTVALGDHIAAVFEVPGHTRGHIAYHFAADRALFCGDTLFSLGCGRLFEGTPQQMWQSLLKLRALPDDTMVYCAHEYTNANADFALSVDPGNASLKARAEQVVRLREAGEPTVPSALGEEKRANPFLRADDRALQVAIGMSGADPATVFAEVRHRKDTF